MSRLKVKVFTLSVYLLIAEHEFNPLTAGAVHIFYWHIT